MDFLTGTPRNESSNWPRLVENNISKQNSVTCRMCTSRGKLEEIIGKPIFQFKFSVLDGDGCLIFCFFFKPSGILIFWEITWFQLIRARNIVSINLVLTLVLFPPKDSKIWQGVFTIYVYNGQVGGQSKILKICKLLQNRNCKRRQVGGQKWLKNCKRKL